MYKQLMLRGDYGSFRRGDPGIFSSIVGAVKGGVRSLVTGGNPLTGAVSGAISGWSTPAAPRIVVAPAFSMSGGSAPGSTAGAIAALTPGTSMVLPGGGMMGVSPAGTLGYTAGRGKHPNRSGYWTRSGYVAKGSKLVSNRSTNYGNGRALKRALKRAHGFQHLARAVMSFTLTGKKHSAGHFKARRRGK